MKFLFIFIFFTGVCQAQNSLSVLYKEKVKKDSFSKVRVEPRIERLSYGKKDNILFETKSDSFLFIHEKCFSCKKGDVRIKLVENKRFKYFILTLDSLAVRFKINDESTGKMITYHCSTLNDFSHAERNDVIVYLIGDYFFIQSTDGIITNKIYYDDEISCDLNKKIKKFFE